MDKNKSFYFTLVVIFCVILSGLGGYFIGTHFSEKETVKNEVKKDEEKKNENLEVLKDKTIDTLTSITLYNYIKSKSESLTSYLNSLSDSQKLCLAGLSFDKKATLKSLKNKLINTFGTDLDIEGKDYYLFSDDEMPMYFYDEETGTFNYNDNYPGTDVVTNLGSTGIYNYKLIDIRQEKDKYIVEYYGLYETNFFDLGPTWLENGKNIDRVNADNAKDYGYDDDDLTLNEYLDKAFSNNKDDFFKFSYIYKKINNNYVLVDFKQA